MTMFQCEEESLVTQTTVVQCPNQAQPLCEWMHDARGKQLAIMKLLSLSVVTCVSRHGWLPRLDQI